MLAVSLKMLDHNISCHVGEQVEAFSDLVFIICLSKKAKSEVLTIFAKKIP